jgi:dihydroflavonol-4-reductase
MLPEACIAVTGASGHVGCNLVRALLRRGHKVRAVVPSPSPALDGLDLELAIADVRHPETLRAAFRGVDTVFHLAARISIDSDPEGQVHAVNVNGARNAAAAALASGVRRYVHMSSVHAFDLTPTEGEIDEGHRRPGPTRAAYDRSKAAGEAAVRRVIDQGLDAVIVNPVGVIGPCDYGPSRMGRFFLDIARQRLPAVPDGGFQFVDVRDVVQSTLVAAERGRRGENYLLPGHWASSLDLARRAIRCVGGREPRVIPPAIFHAAGHVITLGARIGRRESLLTPEMVRTLQSHRRVSGARAERELGHVPRPLDESVRDLYAWFREQGMLPRTLTPRVFA